MRKRKKKKWTTKNTHLRKFNRVTDIEPVNLYVRIAAWVVIAFGLLVILSIALNNHVVGYDNFIGIPTEWIHSLYD